jgi:hypothetical protein
VTFSDLSAHNHTSSSGTEAFRRGLMSLQLVLTTTLFSRHVQTPLRKCNGCEPTAAVGINTD